MEHLQAYNKKLLSNILPVHVADFFMSGDKNNDVWRGAVVTETDNFLSAGTLPRAVRQRLHHLCLHPQLLRVLRGIGVQQRGRGMPQTSK